VVGPGNAVAIGEPATCDTKLAGLAAIRSSRQCLTLRYSRTRGRFTASLLIPRKYVGLAVRRIADQIGLARHGQDRL
jgi:hypothetical protein